MISGEQLTFFAYKDIFTQDCPVRHTPHSVLE